MNRHAGIIEIIGLAVAGELGAVALALIRDAQVLAGGARLLDCFPHFTGERVILSSPLERAFAAIAQARGEGRRVVVLADGDPLFFGIGARLIEYFGKDALRFTPAVTAVAAACAKFGLPWQDLPVVSLHGRDDPAPLLAALAAKGRAAVYTDGVNSPDALARRLLDLGFSRATLRVVENCGMPEERARELSLQEAAQLSFAPLNTVIVEAGADHGSAPALGRPDEFYESENGLITKWPVRACALAALRLGPDSVLWDVGAGSGAMSIEACAVIRTGRVFAVEREPSRCELIRANRKRSCAWLVEVAQGEAPGAFATLPDPDRIFLGGGLHGVPEGETPDILATACARLKPGGRLTANIVLLGSLHAAMEHLRSLGWPVAITQIQASLSSALAGDTRLGAQNPVFILCADKPPTPMLP